MKKRTVITSEKREVWIISEGGVRREIPEEQADVSAYASESLTVPNQDDSDALPEEERKEGNV